MNRTDDFNRANTNAGLGTPSDGISAWINDGGFYGINGNRAYLDGSSGSNIQALESSEADGTIQFTITDFTGGGTSTIAANIIGRFADASNFIRIDCQGDAFVMFKVVAGTPTNVGFRLCTITAGSVVRLDMSGTTCSVWLDGVKQGADFTINEAALNSNTKHGFIIAAPGSAVRIEQFDFFGAAPAGPAIVGATISAPTVLELEFDAAVAIGAGGNGGVSVDLSGGAATAAYSSGAGTATLVYGLSRAISGAETGTADYAQPGNGIEAATGGADAPSFSGEPIVNLVDSTAPFLDDAEIAAGAEDEISLTFSESVANGTGTPTVKENGNAVSVSMAGAGAARTLTRASGLFSIHSAVTVSITSAMFADGAGNPVDAETDFPVTNGAKVLIASGETISQAADWTGLTRYDLNGVTLNVAAPGYRTQGAGPFSRINTTINNGGKPATLTRGTEKAVTGATNAAPIRITTATDHGLDIGDVVVIENVGGNTNANGVWYADPVSATEFDLYTDSIVGAPRAGNAAYTSGGTILDLMGETLQEADALNTTVWTATTGDTFVDQGTFLDGCAIERFSFTGTIDIPAGNWDGYETANAKIFPAPIDGAAWGSVTPALSRNGLLIDGNGTGLKLASNLHITRGNLALNGTTNWTIRGFIGDGAGESGGDRVGITSTGNTNLTVEASATRGVYIHHRERYLEWPNNQYGSQVTTLTAAFSDNVLFKDIIVNAFEWGANGFDAELTNFFIFNLYSHNWIIGLAENAYVHDGIFGPRYDGVYEGLNSGLFQHTAALNVRLRRITAHGGPGFAAPAVRVGGGVIMDTIQDCLFYKFAVPANRACIEGAITEPLPIASPGDRRVNTASHNAFYNPDADPTAADWGISKADGSAPDTGDLSGIDPDFLDEPISFPYTDADIRNGVVSITDILADIFRGYTPTAPQYMNADSAGTGTMGAMDWEPDGLSVTQGGTPVGDNGGDAMGTIERLSAQSREYTVTNNGAAPVILGTITVGAGLAKTADPSGQTIEPAESVTLTVSIDTAVPAAIDAQISIPSNDPDTPYNWALTATVADTVAPTLLGITGRVGQTRLRARFSETLAAIVPDAGDFAMAGAAFFDPVEVTGDSVYFDLAAPLAADDVITVSYTPGTNKIQDAAGNFAAGFTDAPAVISRPGRGARTGLKIGIGI